MKGLLFVLPQIQQIKLQIFHLKSRDVYTRIKLNEETAAQMF